MARRPRAAVQGPLEEFADGFSAELVSLGYTVRGREGQLYLMKHLSQWLATEDLTAADLSAGVAERFFAARRCSHSQMRTELALRPLLTYLRRRGEAPAAPVAMAVGSVEVLLERFASYLSTDRGLAVATVRSYVSQVRPFVSANAGDEIALASLTPSKVADFVTGRAVGQRQGSVAVGANALRALLRWMWQEKMLSSQLAESVGSVALRRDTALPRSLSAVEVSALFASLCESGRLRDEPMLALMSRMGLRAGEVASLVLEDVDWRNGLIVVIGKGARRESMPLTDDVGSLLAAYVEKGRPRGTPHRHVFLALIAPYRPLAPASVSDVASRALRAAGISGPGAAHRLRHTAACGVLSAGGGLVEAGQLLRHATAAATAIYARSDRSALAALALPWPIGVTR